MREDEAQEAEEEVEEAAALGVKEWRGDGVLVVRAVGVWGLRGVDGFCAVCTLCALVVLSLLLSFSFSFSLSLSVCGVGVPSLLWASHGSNTSSLSSASSPCFPPCFAIAVLENTPALESHTDTDPMGQSECLSRCMANSSLSLSLSLSVWAPGVGVACAA